MRNHRTAAAFATLLLAACQSEITNANAKTLGASCASGTECASGRCDEVARVCIANASIDGGFDANQVRDAGSTVDSTANQDSSGLDAATDAAVVNTSCGPVITETTVLGTSYPEQEASECFPNSPTPTPTVVRFPFQVNPGKRAVFASVTFGSVGFSDSCEATSCSQGGQNSSSSALYIANQGTEPISQVGHIDMLFRGSKIQIAPVEHIFARTTIAAACLPSSDFTSGGSNLGNTMQNAREVFGLRMWNVYVSANGVIQFAPDFFHGGGLPLENVALSAIPYTPRNLDPNAPFADGISFVAPFWDQIPSPDEYQYQLKPRFLDRPDLFAAEWNAWGIELDEDRNFVRDWLRTGNDRMRFQAHVYQDGSIEFHYCDVGSYAALNGSSATVGLRVGFGSPSVNQASFNEAGSVAAGLGYRFVPQ